MVLLCQRIQRIAQKRDRVRPGSLRGTALQAAYRITCIGADPIILSSSSRIAWRRALLNSFVLTSAAV